MLTKSTEPCFTNENFNFGNVTIEIDVDDRYYSAEPFPSDDIWDKFNLDGPSIDFYMKDDETEFARPPIANRGHLVEIRNHDCMWAGHCGSKEHPTNDTRQYIKQHSSSAPGNEKAPAVKQQATGQAGRSLLLKTAFKPPLLPILLSPESPPISDDEEPKSKSNTFQLLNDACSDDENDEDSDLCEYFEDSEEFMSEPVEPPQVKSRFPVENDHSYHKDKNASMHISSLGIETPSDSEEEIDVVSVGEKQNVSNKGTYSLPTNPSSRDRQQLQRTMASAINGKQITHGIKTLPPIRKSSSGEQTPIKKQTSEARAMKRSRHYRTTLNNPPYKRRNTCAQSSDSEAEPLERRSLHNNMERQRRIDLANLFLDLRTLVPEVSSREKAPKVLILNEAGFYCDRLGSTSVRLSKQLEDLQKQQSNLRARLSQLRKNLAANR